MGLLVDRVDFPLRVGCWEGNKADTGMLSTSSLEALDQAGLGFIAGSRATKAPADLDAHFAWHGDALADGQVIDTITPTPRLHQPGTRPERP
nr:hypothetical protein [Actinomyces ruminis]